MPTAFDIEDGVPLPSAPVRKRGRGPKPGQKFQARLPLRDMTPGQSLFVGTVECSLNKLRQRIHRLCHLYGERYTTRACIENGIEGTRVWRTK